MDGDSPDRGDDRSGLDPRLDRAIETTEALNDRIDTVADDLKDEFDASERRINDRIDDAADRLKAEVGDVGDDVSGLSGDLDDVQDAILTEVQRQHERTRDRVDDQHESTRGAVSDEAGATRDRVADEHGRTRAAIDDVDGAVDDLSDQVADEHDATRDRVDARADELSGEHDELSDSHDDLGDDIEDVEDTVNDRADDLEDEHAATRDRLDELEDGYIQDLLDEKDDHRETVADLKDETLAKVEEQAEKRVQDGKEYATKINADMAYVVESLTGDGFDHAAFQNAVGTGAQALGVEGVDTVDATDGGDMRTVMNVVYGEDTVTHGALDDPLTGATLSDEGGYTGVATTVWNSIVQQTYDELLDARHEGAAVDETVVSTVETYMTEGGDELERTLSSSLPETEVRGKAELLRFMDFTAQDVGRYLEDGAYEEAVETLEASYSPEGFRDIATGEIEVGA